MKYSFSTLGCPGWSWNDVFTTAKDLGFSGVEIRGLEETMFAPAIDEFLGKNIASTKAYLEKHKIEIPVLASGSCLADEKKAGEAFVEACSYVNLAHELGVKYIRVLGTGEPQITAGDFKRGAELYAGLCEYAALWGVIPLIETNGALSKSGDMLEFLEKSGDNGGVLWDVHHTVRFGAEAPKTTLEKLDGKIKHVHVKDSTIENGKIKYAMMGYGDLPVKEAISALKDTKYDGYVSLEWVKRWNPDLQEPGIVFAHYASFVNNL